MKRNKFLYSLILLGAPSLLFAQEGITQFGRTTGQAPYPIYDYQELTDHNQPDPEAWKKVKGVQISWANANLRYAKHNTPSQGLLQAQQATAWRGESVNAQLLLWSNQEAGEISFSFTPLRNGSNEIPASSLSGGFLRYVLTDQLLEGNNCASRDHSKIDSSLVADVIDHLTPALKLTEMMTQPIWVKCTVPTDAKPGSYKGAIEVKLDGKAFKTLPFTVKVLNRSIGKPADWSIHLDLWQSPFAVARYYQVPLWSKEHLDAMRPTMMQLAQAGQKVITTTIMHKPWGGQTEDPFESMVNWTRKLDGSWSFEYDVFDRWVEFMMECGIDQQINCYSMIPWALSFQYFDQASNRLQALKVKPSDPEYHEVWTAMLHSFVKHLKAKGWFDITTIAMDERPMRDMQQALSIIRKVSPDLKVSLAGHYHSELDAEIYDYSIAIAQNYPEGVLERRKSEGKHTTYYTCCTEERPNTFTVSELAEAPWTTLYCAKEGMDGYLRWAFNSWVKEPLLDSRFRTWTGGDTYMVYPGGRSSNRFEKFIEGVQAYEKIQILRKELKEQNRLNDLKKIEEGLAQFELGNFPEGGAEKQVNQMQQLLNSIR
ncbi:MAG: glycoside hydrolase domain-containing protein [Phocaeicola sp.]